MYEYDYIKKLVKESKVHEAKLQTFRHQDDCIAFNGDGVFALHYSNIYPPEMKLENINISKGVLNFLDLRSISVFRGKFRNSTYDKRRSLVLTFATTPITLGIYPSMGSMVFHGLLKYTACYFAFRAKK